MPGLAVQGEPNRENRVNSLYALTGFSAACLGTVLVTPLVKRLAAWAGK